MFIQKYLFNFHYFTGLTVQLFDHLWESSEVISNAGFLKWETNSDVAEQEGKGLSFLLSFIFFLFLFLFFFHFLSLSFFFSFLPSNSM